LQPDKPLIWIDNSLSPLTASALKIVEYNIVVQADISEFRQLRNVLDDEHIIPWLERRGGVWVHKDNAARTAHARQILTAGIRTIWLEEPKGADFSSAGQLRLLAFALPKILGDWAKAEPEWNHYAIGPHGTERIKIRGMLLQPPESRNARKPGV